MQDLKIKLSRSCKDQPQQPQWPCRPYCLGATEALSRGDIATNVFNLARIRARFLGYTIFDPALESLEDGGGLAAEAAGTVPQTRGLKKAPEVMDVWEEHPGFIVQVLYPW